MAMTRPNPDESLPSPNSRSRAEFEDRVGHLREGSNPSKRKRRRCLTRLVARGGTESLNPCSVDSTDAPVHQQVCLALGGTNVHLQQTGTP